MQLLEEIQQLDEQDQQDAWRRYRELLAQGGAATAAVSARELRDLMQRLGLSAADVERDSRIVAEARQLEDRAADKQKANAAVRAAKQALERVKSDTAAAAEQARETLSRIDAQIGHARASADCASREVDEMERAAGQLQDLRRQHPHLFDEPPAMLPIRQMAMLKKYQPVSIDPRIHDLDPSRMLSPDQVRELIVMPEQTNSRGERARMDVCEVARLPNINGAVAAAALQSYARAVEAKKRQIRREEIERLLRDDPDPAEGLLHLSERYDTKTLNDGSKQKLPAPYTLDEIRAIDPTADRHRMPARYAAKDNIACFWGPEVAAWARRVRECNAALRDELAELDRLDRERPGPELID